MHQQLGDRAGVVGAAIMVVEHVLDPAVIDRAVQNELPAQNARAYGHAGLISSVRAQSGRPVCRMQGDFGSKRCAFRAPLWLTAGMAEALKGLGV